MTASTLENRLTACEGRRQVDYPPAPSLPSHCCGLEKSGCLWRNGCAAWKFYQRALAEQYEQEREADVA